MGLTGSSYLVPSGARVRVFDDAVELGRALAEDIVARHAAEQGALVLGCPAGRSLRTTYRALAARRPLERLVVAMMDEYAGAAEAAHYSCSRFAREEIAGPLGLPEERLLIPSPDEPAAFERALAAHGGVDLFLLASGTSDGHVGFLPPGSPREGRTGVVDIAESTRRDNLATFPGFASLEEVPRRGVTVGLGTIADAGALRLVLHGREKREAAKRLLSLGAFDASWPASIVHDHPDAEIWLDRAALGDARRYSAA